MFICGNNKYQSLNTYVLWTDEIAMQKYKNNTENFAFALTLCHFNSKNSVNSNILYIE